jgi:hypothetical protein
MEPDIDVLTKEGLTAQGFTGFQTIREIQRNGLPRSVELNQHGIYAVVSSRGYSPEFIGPDRARRNCNVIRPWSFEKLGEKWVPEVEVLYFGMAGTRVHRGTLRKRIGDLTRHCMGKTTKQGPHRGGELLWQLEGYTDFELGYLPTEEPESEERRLINIFLEKTGKPPFGNRIPRSLVQPPTQRRDKAPR